MTQQTRRDFLKTAGGVAAAGAFGTTGTALAANKADLPFEIESGAKLNVLRWTQFVPAAEKRWMANTKTFTELHGVDVKVDRARFQEIRPKARGAARKTG